MVVPFARLIARLVSRDSRSAHRPRARLGMEPLEARDVPASFLWLNQYGSGDGQFGNPYNWREGAVPGSGDDIVFNEARADRATRATA